MALDFIRPEQPRGADTGKNVEVADAEHDLWPAVDHRSPGMRRLPKGKDQRRSRRQLRDGEHFVTVGLSHAPGDGANMGGARRNDLNINHR